MLAFRTCLKFSVAFILTFGFFFFIAYYFKDTGVDNHAANDLDNWTGNDTECVNNRPAKDANNWAAKDAKNPAAKGVESGAVNDVETISKSFDIDELFNDERVKSLERIFAVIQKSFMEVIGLSDPRDRTEIASEAELVKNYTDTFQELVDDDKINDAGLVAFYTSTMTSYVSHLIWAKVLMEQMLRGFRFYLRENPLGAFYRLDEIVRCLRSCTSIAYQIQNKIGIPLVMEHVIQNAIKILERNSLVIKPEEIEISDIQITIAFSDEDLQNDDHIGYIRAISYLENRVRRSILDESVRKAILDAIMKEYVRRSDFVWFDDKSGMKFEDYVVAEEYPSPASNQPLLTN